MMQQSTPNNLPPGWIKELIAKRTVFIGRAFVDPSDPEGFITTTRALTPEEAEEDI
jgi:hypothetical protein